MTLNNIYRCPNCGAILVIPKTSWQNKIKCTVCDDYLIKLEDDWDLSEIISECELGLEG
jgi:DNA-directed RNA polymerase subunit RPC12/RpoP